MRIQVQSRPQGIALIIVMMVIVSLGLLAGEFAYRMKVETTLARNSNMDSDLEWLARSGVELAKYVLSQPGQGGMAFDALNQKWAGGTGDTNSPVADLPLDHYELKPGVISVKIVDLDRKFNINTINPENADILRQATVLMGMDAAESSKIIGAVLNWTDAKGGTQLGTGDAGDSYYLSLPQPYHIKKGPMDDITEMMLIRYITPEMFYGSGASGLPTRSSVRRGFGSRGVLEEPTYPIGFADLFTTLTSGQVNINTASANVLQMLDMEMEDQYAQAIINARSGYDRIEGNEDDMPFHNIGELARQGVTPRIPDTLIRKLSQLCTVRSSTFEVQVDAQIATYRRHYVAYVRRDGNRLVTLYMYYH